MALPYRRRHETDFVRWRKVRQADLAEDNRYVIKHLTGKRVRRTGSGGQRVRDLPPAVVVQEASHAVGVEAVQEGAAGEGVLAAHGLEVRGGALGQPQVAPERRRHEVPEPLPPHRRRRMSEAGSTHLFWQILPE